MDFDPEMAAEPTLSRLGTSRKSDLEAARAVNLRANLQRRKAQVQARDTLQSTPQPDQDSSL